MVTFTSVNPPCYRMWTRKKTVMMFLSRRRKVEMIWMRIPLSCPRPFILQMALFWKKWCDICTQKKGCWLPCHFGHWIVIDFSRDLWFHRKKCAINFMPLHSWWSPSDFQQSKDYWVDKGFHRYLFQVLYVSRNLKCLSKLFTISPPLSSLQSAHTHTNTCIPWPKKWRESVQLLVYLLVC